MVDVVNGYHNVVFEDVENDSFKVEIVNMSQMLNAL